MLSSYSPATVGLRYRMKLISRPTDLNYTYTSVGIALLLADTDTLCDPVMMAAYPPFGRCFFGPLRSVFRSRSHSVRIMAIEYMVRIME